MRVRITAAAAAELAEAVAWYKAHAPEQGGRFVDEFEALIARLVENPRQFPIARGDARRAGFRRFPYGLFFRVQGEFVQVFACFHGNRDPRRWHERT